MHKEIRQNLIQARSRLLVLQPRIPLVELYISHIPSEICMKECVPRHNHGDLQRGMRNGQFLQFKCPILLSQYFLTQVYQENNFCLFQGKALLSKVQFWPCLKNTVYVVFGGSDVLDCQGLHYFYFLHCSVNIHFHVSFPL